MEKFKMVIDETVCGELMQKGYNLIAQMPSYTVEGRRVYVFANSEALERDILDYEPSTYYKDVQEVQ